MLKYIEQELIKKFKGRHFEREELYDFYRHYEPNLNRGTFGWRIYDLKQKGIIENIKVGTYTISVQKKFVPDSAEKIIQLSKVMCNDFVDVDYCMFTTEWFNYFTRHQLGRFFYILEVEKDFIEDVFHAYLDPNLRVLLKPDKQTMDRYLEYDNTLIIKPLISRCPKQKIVFNDKSNIKIPTIEKLLVDVFCDDITYFQVQGRELETIFENAINNFNINYSRLFNYAKRRAKREQLEQFLRTKFPNQSKHILE